MKISKFLLIPLALAPFAIIGCATTQIYGSVFPQADGSYKGIATAHDERTALKMAEKDAKTTCKVKEKAPDFVVVNQSSKYIGPKVASANETGFTRLTMKALEFAAKNKNEENYKVEMHFKCR